MLRSCHVQYSELLVPLKAIQLKGQSTPVTAAQWGSCRTINLNPTLRTELFIIPQASLELARPLSESQQVASEPADETLRQLLQGLTNLTLHPCVKSPFYDAMQAKLQQLARSHSNEVNSFDVDSLANAFLAADQCDGDTASE